MKDSWKNIPGLLDEWRKIRNRINFNHNVFPEKSKLFRCFDFFDLQDTQCLILGLSPYKLDSNTKIPLATGLAFGLPYTKDNSLDTPSLEIIRDALAIDLNEIAVEDYLDYTLESWANQGVLLLNACLSVTKFGKADIHCVIWEKFIDLILLELNKLKIPCVLCGRVAQIYEPLLKDCPILKVPHPVAQQYRKHEGNIDDKYIFTNKEIFKFLNKNTKKEIQWLSY